MPTRKSPDTEAIIPLPRSLGDLLRVCQVQERTLGGINRRTAFRVTRIFVGALIAAGFSPVAVAHALGISPESIRARIEHDGILEENIICALMGWGVDQWAEFTERHAIAPIARSEPSSVRAIDIVLALAMSDSPASTAEPDPG